jgi:hypothetical protein
VSGKRVEGTVRLAEHQALVVSKFCFDFNPRCGLNDPACRIEQHPGLMEFYLYSGQRSDGRAVVTGPMLPPGTASSITPFGARGSTVWGAPDVYIALLDDEYFSFPEVSQVWGEANCTDVLKAAKKNFKLNWDQVRTTNGEHITTPLAERLRPRWWYIALVSCSAFPIELSYKMHLTNQLIGWEREFSMDTAGLIEMTCGLCVLLGGLLVVQLGSLSEWMARSGRCDRLHPALHLVTGALTLATVGFMSWFAYFLHFQSNGVAEIWFDVFARGCIMAAKTVMQILFMLQAQGQSITSPDISWSDSSELVVGQFVFGCLSFILEVWSDSEFWSTTTEYVYDTRPGIALVAFDCLWLWMYVSKSFQTFRSETRARPRKFYKVYAPIFAIWFASLPLTAALGRVLSPWVRHRITFILGGVVHTATLAVLVHSFRPHIAVTLYDLKTAETEPVLHSEELDAILGSSKKSCKFWKTHR